MFLTMNEQRYNSKLLDLKVCTFGVIKGLLEEREKEELGFPNDALFEGVFQQL